MKDYMKPEVEVIKFVSESITDIIDGDLCVGSANEQNPWGE